MVKAEINSDTEIEIIEAIIQLLLKFGANPDVADGTCIPATFHDLAGQKDYYYWIWPSPPVTSAPDDEVLLESAEATFQEENTAPTQENKRKSATSFWASPFRLKSSSEVSSSEDTEPVRKKLRRNGGDDFTDPTRNESDSSLGW